MFAGGWKGFCMAAIFTSFATTGGGNLVNFSGECKNPTKDLPFAIVLSTLVVTALYTIIGFVAAGVLPVEVSRGSGERIPSGPAVRIFRNRRCASCFVHHAERYIWLGDEAGTAGECRRLVPEEAGRNQ